MEDLAQVYLEIYKGKHGQSDTEYQAGRSDAGKRISGDADTGPRYYTLGRSRGAKPDAPTAPGARPVNSPKMSSSEKEYYQYNKSDSNRRTAAGYNKVGGSKGLPGSVNAGYEPEDEMVEAKKMKDADPCWDSHKMVGTKKKGGKEVPNCVPKEEFELWVEELWNEGYDLSEWTWEGLFEYYLDERKVEPDEKLPSGKTPNEKMDRAHRRHGARYRLSGGGRNNPARDSHFSRGSKIDKISNIMKSGGDPRQTTGMPGYGDDARKIGRPGVSTADRTSRTQRNDDTDAKSTYTQGGLRAHKTKAGGYRTLVKKESFDIVAEFLFVEGYTDTIESAELMAENISETWVNQILDEAEKVFPLGKVADKMRKVDGEMKSSKSPEEKAKLRKRLDAMGDQYWQPN